MQQEECNKKGIFIPENTDNLDDIIKSAAFPEDYDAFDDELLDMIP